MCDVHRSCTFCYKAPSVERRKNSAMQARWHKNKAQTAPTSPTTQCAPAMCMCLPSHMHFFCCCCCPVCHSELNATQGTIGLYAIYTASFKVGQAFVGGWEQSALTSLSSVDPCAFVTGDKQEQLRATKKFVTHFTGQKKKKKGQFPLLGSKVFE